MKAWVGEANDLIELFYLPSYNPQLNPDEHLNADLKLLVGKHMSIRTKAKLREAIHVHLVMLEQTPEQALSFFQAKRVLYMQLDPSSGGVNK